MSHPDVNHHVTLSMKCTNTMEACKWLYLSCNVACSTYGIPLASTPADALDHPDNVNKDAGPCGDVHALHHPFHTRYGQSSQKFLVGLYLGFMHVHALRCCSSPQLTSMRFVGRDYGFVHRWYLLGASPMAQYISRLARVTTSCIIGGVYRLGPKLSKFQFFGPILSCQFGLLPGSVFELRLFCSSKQRIIGCIGEPVRLTVPRPKLDESMSSSSRF